MFAISNLGYYLALLSKKKNKKKTFWKKTTLCCVLYRISQYMSRESTNLNWLGQHKSPYCGLLFSRWLTQSVEVINPAPYKSEWQQCMQTQNLSVVEL